MLGLNPKDQKRNCLKDLVAFFSFNMLNSKFSKNILKQDTDNQFSAHDFRTVCTSSVFCHKDQNVAGLCIFGSSSGIQQMPND